MEYQGIVRRFDRQAGRYHVSEWSISPRAKVFDASRSWVGGCWNFEAELRQQVTSISESANKGQPPQGWPFPTCEGIRMDKRTFMPTWTQQKPKTPGWYWMLSPGKESSLPTIVQIVPDRETRRWLALIPASYDPKTSST